MPSAIGWKLILDIAQQIGAIKLAAPDLVRQLRDDPAGELVPVIVSAAELLELDITPEDRKYFDDIPHCVRHAVASMVLYTVDTDCPLNLSFSPGPYYTARIVPWTDNAYGLELTGPFASYLPGPLAAVTPGA